MLLGLNLEVETSDNCNSHTTVVILNVVPSDDFLYDVTRVRHVQCNVDCVVVAVCWHVTALLSHCRPAHADVEVRAIYARNSIA